MIPANVQDFCKLVHFPQPVLSYWQTLAGTPCGLDFFLQLLRLSSAEIMHLHEWSCQIIWLLMWKTSLNPSKPSKPSKCQFCWTCLSRRSSDFLSQNSQVSKTARNTWHHPPRKRNYASLIWMCFWLVLLGPESTSGLKELWSPRGIRNTISKVPNNSLSPHGQFRWLGVSEFQCEATK